MSKIKHYTIDDLLTMEINYNWMIDGFLREGDMLLFKAQKKVGKGVMAQQFGHALTDGTKLFDSFNVTQKYNVAYCFGEGYIGNWKDRVINMGKMCPYDSERLHFFDCVKGRLYTDKYADALLERLKAAEIDFDVIIFDPLYRLCSGASYNDDEKMTMFFDNVEMIQKEFNAASIIIHHDSEKIYRDTKGEKHSSASRTNAMGSSVITMAPTHYYTLEKWKESKTREVHRLRIGEDRSGTCIKELDLFMVKPAEDADGRLGYTLDGEECNIKYATIKHYIQEKGRVSDHRPYEDMGVSSSTFYRHIPKLMDQGFISKIEDNGKSWYVWNIPEEE